MILKSDVSEPMAPPRKRARIANAFVLGLAGLLAAACASAPSGPQPYGGAPIRGPAPAPSPAPAIGAPRIVDIGEKLQCVPFARRLSGVEIYGDAETWWAKAQGRFRQTSAPEIGSVLAVKGYRPQDRGHVAVVTALSGPRLMFVAHANWLNGEEVSVDVPIADVSPANDWTQIKIWHIPGGHWGGRTYAAWGFIHPHYNYLAASLPGAYAGRPAP